MGIITKIYLCLAILRLISCLDSKPVDNQDGSSLDLPGGEKEYQEHNAGATRFTEKEIAEFKEIFSIYDTDRDSAITQKELNITMRLSGQNPTAVQLEDIFNKAGSDGDGTIHFEEFLKKVEHRPKDTRSKYWARIRKEFEVFDRDGDYLISAAEFQHRMRTLDLSFTDTEVGEMIRKEDSDHDGRINYGEFVHMMV